MTDLTISLIIPVYNAEDDLEHLFETLIFQTKQIDEVIFVDNQSKDNSLKMLKNFQEHNKDKNIVVITEAKKGPSAVRNTGLSKAKSDILALTDSDCMLDKDWCKNILKRFKNDFFYDIIGGDASGTEIFGKKQKFKSYTEEFSYYYWTKNRQSNAAFPMNNIDDFFSSAPFTVATYNVAMKRNVFEKTNGFNEELLNNEDTDFWMRCCRKGLKSLVGIPEIIVCHRNRKELSSLYRQYHNYGKGLPFLLKKYFRNRFLITFRSQKIFEFPFFTGLIEINPHTILTFLIITHLLLFPSNWIIFYPLFLLIARYYLIHSYIKNFVKPTFKRVLSLVLIMETRQIAWSVAAFKGMFKHMAICFI